MMSQLGSLATLCAMRLLRFGLSLALVLAAGCLRTLSADGPQDGDDEAEDGFDLPPQPTPDAALVPQDGSFPRSPSAPAASGTPAAPTALPSQPLTPTTVPPFPGFGSPLPVPLIPTTAPTPEQSSFCAAQPIAGCNSTMGCSLVTDHVVDAQTGCATGEKRSHCLAGRLFCGILGSQIAKDASGRHYRVLVGCVASDLTPLSPQPILSSACEGPSAQAQSACALHLDRDSCVGDPRWTCYVTMAGRFDPERRCVDPASERGVFVGCTGSYGAGQPGHFRDRQGEIWEVPAPGVSKVPTTWQPIDPASVIPGAKSFPPCYIEL
jgi:hypothetical protein